MLSWSTDVHLDHLTPESEGYQRWIRTLNLPEVTGVLITGDIADGLTITGWLERVAQDVTCPVYFVLGNHDYYKSSIAHVRKTLSEFTRPRLYWLDQCSPIELSSTLSLVGSSGWGDGRIGDVLNTPIRINDHRLIQELTLTSRVELADRLKRLGESEAARVSRQLSQVKTERVIVATHVPPFRESTWYSDRYGDKDWMPDFCCGAMGEMLNAYALEYPERQLTVFCGHSHGEGAYEPLPNLKVFTGAATYGQPRVAGLINGEGVLTDHERYPRATPWPDEA